MSNIHSDNYYEVMGIAVTATETEVKKAYRTLALLWHPVRFKYLTKLLIYKIG
jgi:curved DNA-binding protein CbpA